MSLSILNPERPSGSYGAIPGLLSVPPPRPPGTLSCPSCGGDLPAAELNSGWQNCPYCEKRLQVRSWPVARRDTNATAAAPEQATCFFHPEKAFQACCQRCGRFVCALCDLQLGSEHVCPSCFDHGRADSKLGSSSEWRERDVLWDSIAVMVGWAWIVVWPTIVVAIPAAIYLHVRYRKAPRSYLVPRRGWRFWMAYVGLAWLPLSIGFVFYMARTAARR